jgi:hypothetical protein
VATALPDYWVACSYIGGQQVVRQQGLPITGDLPVGPTAANDGLSWMVNRGRRAKGMAYGSHCRPRRRAALTG